MVAVPPQVELMREGTTNTFSLTMSMRSVAMKPQTRDETQREREKVSFQVDEWCDL